VRFLDLVPTEDVPELLATADIHLLPHRSEAADLVLPSKLAPMLASSRLTIAMAPYGSALHAEVEGCGFATSSGDTAAWTAAMRGLARDEKTRRRIGEAGPQRAVTRWNRTVVVDQFLRGLDSPRNEAGTRYVS
jgi:colanic acid biosynthesis glycosyl transferase WcaI